MIPAAWGRRLWLTCLVAPALLVLIGFVVVPIASAFLYSLYSWNGLARGEFSGLENFRVMLFVEPFAGWTWRALSHNLIVFASLMVVQNGTAFLVAFLLLKTLPGHRFHQVAIFLPVILSSVIVGAMWKLFLNPIFGLVNQGLAMVGLGTWAQPWLGQPSTALGSLVLVNTWHWLGFPALVFLAGMQRISREVMEAARLDGATDWQMMRHIVWPLVAPATTVVVILTFIGSMNWFEMPYVMTGLDGSPAGATDVLGLYFYRTAFGSATSGLQDFGRSSALAVMMFLVIAVIATVWTRVLRRREIQE
ncbi:MAG: sugar ABC transporter permease [Alphaproteobacteria bacterium]|nr:sugar ABC transporter permease [Alphaproteobacteria bacterium]